MSDGGVEKYPFRSAANISTKKKPAMRFVRHTEECTSKPVAGRLTGKCDCKTAPLDQKAREQLQRLLDELAEDSIDADEASEYFALRLDELAEQIAKEARSVRRNAKRSDRASRVAAQTKRFP